MLEAYNRAWARLGGKSGFQVSDSQIRQVLQRSINVMEAAKALDPKSTPYLLQDILDKKRIALSFDVSSESLSLAISLFIEERDTARRVLEGGILPAVATGQLLARGRLSRAILNEQEMLGKRYLSSCAVITFFEAKQLSGMSSSEARRVIVSRTVSLR